MDLVDRCIECGFCEPVCPSQGLTLTPRQRIVIWREIRERQRKQGDSAALEASLQHAALDTCAATGLCKQRCPVDINTGDLVRSIRGQQLQQQRVAKAMMSWFAAHFALTLNLTRGLLRMLDLCRSIFGATMLSQISARLSRWLRLPLWSPAMPVASAGPRLASALPDDTAMPKVVYFSACITRAMGESAADPMGHAVVDATLSVLKKAGFSVVFPDHLDDLCCGQPFASKGNRRLGDDKLRQLQLALLRASDDGKIPVLCDTSPCSLRLLTTELDSRIQVFDSVEFIHEKLLPRLQITPVSEQVALHATCSTQHLGQVTQLREIVTKCADTVVQPEDIHCCGFAGDKGFVQPELNQHALRSLPLQVQGCQHGVSTSRSCEIGLFRASGIPYRNVMELVDRASSELCNPEHCQHRVESH